MRTNIVIDDALMKEALDLSGLATKREVVQRALETFVRLQKQQKIRKFRGKLAWDGDLDAMRSDYEELGGSAFLAAEPSAQ
jgi:Arc/MetJ family transcription regulator